MFAERYGQEINEISMIPNTNKLLQIGEYAKDIGKSEELNEIVFKAVFVENRNISLMEEIIKLCKSVGITEEEIEKVLNSDQYKIVLNNHKDFCHDNNITSVPTFIINDQIAIVGAQNPDNFRKAFEQVIQ